MRARPSARALIAGTTTTGVALLVVASAHLRPVPLGTLALLGAAVLATELFVVPHDDSSFDLRDTTDFTFSASVHLAAVMLLGPWAAALVAAFGVVSADGLRRRPLPQIAFNASAQAIAAVCGGYVFIGLGGEPGAFDLPGAFPAIAALVVVMYGITALLVAAVVALEGGTPFESTAREAVSGGVAAALGEAGLGAALASFALHVPWAIPTLFPLLFAVYRSHERLVALRRETARALETFANVVDERDSYTYQHSARVAEYVRALAEGLALPARTVAELRWAGRLHDLGKITVDASVLRKPSHLDESEWRAIRLHPRLSTRLLRRFRLASGQAKAVEYHHERMDGQGYYGVPAPEIPLAAHFLVLADSYDAMTSERPYRDRLSKEAALAEIEAHAGTQFHPSLAKAFVALQRGEDPLAALTADERAELRRKRTGRPARRLRHELRVRSHWIVAAPLIAALMAIGAGLAPLAIPAVAGAAAALVIDRREAYRARRLAANIRQMLGEGLPPNAVFIALVAKLSLACELRWAGLVSWREREYDASLEIEWRGGGQSPTPTALTSWLVREAESTSGPLVAAGAELGRDDAHLAIPLRRGAAMPGYLVLAVAGRVPRTVREAVADCSDGLAQALLAPEIEPLSRPLKAVV